MFRISRHKIIRIQLVVAHRQARGELQRVGFVIYTRLHRFTGPRRHRHRQRIEQITK
jgi:hypothetical protein